MPEALTVSELYGQLASDIRPKGILGLLLICVRRAIGGTGLGSQRGPSHALSGTSRGSDQLHIVL